MKQEREVKGEIAVYNLQDWWLSTFSEEERNFIVAKYNRNEPGPSRLTDINITFSSLHITQFLSTLASWFTKAEYSSIANRIRERMKEEAKRNPRNDSGCIRGRHYTTYVEDVKDLVRAEQLDEAEELLLELLDAVELESKIDNVIPPWYYFELAIVYRKQKEYEKEIETITRYLTQNFGHDYSRHQKLTTRLKKANQLLSKQVKKP